MDVIVQPSNFTPVCIEYQQKIRDYFNWKIEDDEYVLTWLNKNISKTYSWLQGFEA